MPFGLHRAAVTLRSRPDPTGTDTELYITAYLQGERVRRGVRCLPQLGDWRYKLRTNSFSVCLGKRFCQQRPHTSPPSVCSPFAQQVTRHISVAQRDLPRCKVQWKTCYKGDTSHYVQKITGLTLRTKLVGRLP